jgi:heme/copper-type cytochrome/quinol oxidase subunit 4
MKNVIVVAVLAVALTAACFWLLLSDNQAPHSEVIGGSIHRVD